MKNLFLVALLLLCGCGTKKETLHIYAWADYIKPDLIDQFEREKDCIVIVDNFDSNESMFAKLQLGGVSYDIILPSNYFLEVMQKNDLLQPINRDALPNLSYLD